MKAKRKKSDHSRSTSGKTPESHEDDEEHPTRDDDPGAWDDHDCDWILDGRMP